MRNLFTATASLIAICASTANAQSVPAENSPPAAVQDAGLGEIIVTAQRKTENLQRAAIAIDAVGGEDLVKAGISQAGRLQDLVPALSIEPTSSGNLIFIRGVGNFNLTANSDPATAFNYDGVYIGRPSSTEGVFYDLERIEVLKGPQGTLYGRNATAGAINVIPVKPQIGEFSGYGTVGYGNYNALTLEGAVNLPMGANGALRISGTSVTHDGYLADGSSDEDTQALRVQMLAQLTPNFQIRASADFAKQGGEGAGQNYFVRTAFDPVTGSFSSTPSGVDHAGLYSPEAQSFRTTLFNSLLKRNAAPLPDLRTRNHRYYGAHLNLQLETGVGTFNLIPAIRDSEYHDVVVPGFTASVFDDTTQESVELRFASKRFSIFDLTAGLLYYHEEIKDKQSYNVQSSHGFGDAVYETNSKAAYLRATASLTDRFRISGGARYSADKKSVVNQFIGLNAVCLAAACPNAPFIPWTATLAEQPIIPPPNGVVPLGATGAILARSDALQNESKKTGRVTWRAAVEYDVAPRSFAYASVETGYRSGGFNTAGIPPFGAEYITAYTVGLKNSFYNNRLRLNLEGFWWKYKDQQLSFVGVTPAGTPSNLTSNIGAATIKGLEADVSVLATRNTLLNATVQYLNARYDDFVYATPAQSGQPYTTCPTTRTGTVFTVNCTGFPVYNAPKWTMNLAAQQTVPMGKFDLVFDVDTQYRSERYVFFHYAPDQLVSPTWQSNAQVTLEPADKRWSVSAYVRNIENAQYALFAPTPPFLPTVNVQWNAPRTYGARFMVKF